MERENVQTWLQILSQNRKNISKQVAQVKQTIGKFVEKYKSLGERICTLFHEQGVTIVPIFTALSMTVLTIVVDITGVFLGRGGPNASLPTLSVSTVLFEKTLSCIFYFPVYAPNI